MNIYLSKSSTYVKIITMATLILLALVVMSLMISDNNYGKIGGTAIMVLTVGIAIYYYLNSLTGINVTQDSLILKKTYGQIKIPKNDIVAITKMEFSNLTMTYGSKGFFGFIGNTMDDSVSFVKDRKNIVRIKTPSKNYLVSVSEPEKLVAEINSHYKITQE